MDLFEGYVGIRLGDEQLVNDVFFSLLLVLLVVFSFVFRANNRLFTKMIRDVFFVKERSSLFENIVGNEFVFSNFMTFQALFLCSAFLFGGARNYGYINNLNIETTFLLIAITFFIVLLYYQYKKMVYYLTGYIFMETDKYKFWETNYHAITGFWGLFLYVPVVWILFIGAYSVLPVILFVILFFLYRFLVIYKAIRIFQLRGSVFLYIILYLCAQEILPLILLLKGMDYLYNVIEKSAIWH